jgi:hypothetical protein
MPDQSKLKISRDPKCITFHYPAKLTEKEAVELQINAGFHPAGYGMDGFRAIDTLSSWSCYASCD